MQQAEQPNSVGRLHYEFRINGVGVKGNEKPNAQATIRSTGSEASFKMPFKQHTIEIVCLNSTFTGMQSFAGGGNYVER